MDKELGKAIEGALSSLGIAGVASVRQGKVFDVELADDINDADATLRAPDGQILIRPHGNRAATPVTGALVPDDASGLPVATVVALLDRIGYGADAGTVVVLRGSEP